MRKFNENNDDDDRVNSTVSLKLHAAIVFFCMHAHFKVFAFSNFHFVHFKKIKKFSGKSTTEIN